VHCPATHYSLTKFNISFDGAEEKVYTEEGEEGC